MKVLLTGASGLVGSHAAAALSQAGHEVVPVGRGAAVDCDLAAGVPAPEAVGELDAVVHLAQSARYKEFPEGTGDVVAVNVAATAGLLDLARRAGARRFVLASTGGVYAPSPEPLREQDPVSASGFYAASKRAAELLARAYDELLEVVVLRPFFVYGPGQRAGMLVRSMAERVRAGEQVTLQGERGMVFNPVHASDAARAVAAAACGPDAPPVVNVAGAQTTDLLTVVERLGALLGREPRVKLAGEPAPLVVADASVMAERLGVVPQVGIDDGLAAVAESLPPA